MPAALTRTHASSLFVQTSQVEYKSLKKAADLSFEARKSEVGRPDEACRCDYA